MASGRGEMAAALYVLLAVPILIALNFIFIPFHAPDDWEHFKRAYTLAHGALLPVNQAGSPSGGAIDSSLAEMIELQRKAVHQFPRNGGLAEPLGAPRQVRDALRWSGIEQFNDFPGAAAYFPLIYAPQTAAILLGQRLNWTVEDTILAARALNGIASVLLIAAALRFLPFGWATVLVLLLLPKTLVQFASNSADPLLHAITLATLVWVWRAATDGWRPPAWHYALAGCGLLAAIGVRPPMIALALPPLWLAWRQRSFAGAALIMAGVVLSLAWIGIVLPQIVDPRCGNTGTLSGKLLSFLTEGPVLMARSLVVNRNYYLKSFVGELGWGFAPGAQLVELPIWVYYAAAPVLGYALLVDATDRVRPTLELRLVALLSGVGAIVATFFAMYSVCTQVGSWVIGGVQGRYMVGPILMLLPLLAGLFPVRAALARLYVPVLVLFTTAGYAALLNEALRIYWIR